MVTEHDRFFIFIQKFPRKNLGSPFCKLGQGQVEETCALAREGGREGGKEGEKGGRDVIRFFLKNRSRV